MDDMILYVPSGVKSESELFNGLGRRELFQSLVGAGCSGIMAIILWLIFRNVAATIVSILAGIFGSVMMCTKDQNNMSVTDQAIQMIRFSRSQQIYPYRAMQEWRAAKENRK